MALTISIDWKWVIANADATTNDTWWTWTGDWGFTGSGWVSNWLTTDTYKYGSASISAAFSGAKNWWLWFDRWAGNELDFTTTTWTEEWQHIYIWVHCPTIWLTATIANQWVTIRIWSTTGNYRDFTVAWSDWDNWWDWAWKCFVIDATKSWSNDWGTYTHNNIRYIGARMSTTATAKWDNLFISQIAVWKWLKITWTSTSWWSDVATYCNDLTNRAWWMTQEKEWIYYLYWNIVLWSSTQTAITQFWDNSNIMQYGISEYHDWTWWVTSSDIDFHWLTAEDVWWFQTEITDWIIVGTDKWRNWCSFIWNTNHNILIDYSWLTHANSFVKLYWTKFLWLLWGINFHNSLLSLLYSGSIDWTWQFNPWGWLPILRDITFSWTKDKYDTWTEIDWSALLWHEDLNIKDCNFIANLDGVSAPHWIQHDTELIVDYDNLQFSWNDYDIHNTMVNATIDSYSNITTEDWDISWFTAISQPITWNWDTLGKAMLNIKKIGNPTGTIYIAIEALVSGVPPLDYSSPLATSDTLDISTFNSDNYNEEAFIFSWADQITLTNWVAYGLILVYTSASASDTIHLEHARPWTHNANNKYVYIPWFRFSLWWYDLLFKVQNPIGDTIVVNQLNGSNATTVDITAGWSVSLNTSVTLSVWWVSTWHEPYDYVYAIITADSWWDLIAGTEIMNQPCSILSGTTYKTIKTFAYTSDQPVVIKCRFAWYLPFTIKWIITNEGLNINAVWIEDSNYQPYTKIINTPSLYSWMIHYFPLEKNFTKEVYIYWDKFLIDGVQTGIVWIDSSENSAGNNLRYRFSLDQVEYIDNYINFSISLWLRPEETPVWKSTVISNWLEWDWFHFYSDSRKVWFRNTSWTLYDYTITSSFTLNTWTNIIYTYDWSNIRAFVNGVYDGLIAATGTPDFTSVDDKNIFCIWGTVEAFTPSYTRKWIYTWWLDELYIWNTALTYWGVAVWEVAWGDVAILYNEGDGIKFWRDKRF